MANIYGRSDTKSAQTFSENWGGWNTPSRRPWYCDTKTDMKRKSYRQISLMNIGENILNPFWQNEPNNSLVKERQYNQPGFKSGIRDSLVSENQSM